MKKFMTRKETRDYINGIGLPMGKQTLHQLALRGEGPEYKIFNNVAVYKIEDVDRWIAAQIRAPITEARRHG